MSTLEAKNKPAAAATEYSDFNSLLTKEFKAKSEQTKAAVEGAVKTLAEQALANSVTVSDDAYKSIASIIAEIDSKLSEQINLILHHQEFQSLESAWRGLHYLVNNTETDEKLRLRFLDISKDELRRNMKRYKGVAWDQSPLFKKSMKKSTANWAANLMVAWWRITTLTILRLTLICWLPSVRLLLLHTYLLSRVPRRQYCRWNPGKSCQIRVI